MPAPQDQNPDQSLPAEVSDSASKEISARRILVVEDNPVMASIMGKLLSRFVVLFDIVANGEEAINAARDTDYDLILMDILMPKMGGVTASREIRKLSSHYRQIPIIAVTARVSERAMEEYLEEGMSGVVKKPINRINLADILREFLDLEEHSATQGEGDGGFIEDDPDDLDALNWEVFNEYRALLRDKFVYFLQDYLNAAPTMLSEIGTAITEDDTYQIQFLAHKLKSTAQVFGCESVSDLAAQLEIMGKNHETLKAPRVFHELHIAYERTQRALNKKLVLMRNMG